MKFRVRPGALSTLHNNSGFMNEIEANDPSHPIDRCCNIDCCYILDHGFYRSYNREGCDRRN